jgi:hypothetical protein
MAVSSDRVALQSVCAELHCCYSETNERYAFPRHDLFRSGHRKKVRTPLLRWRAMAA